MSDAGHDRLTRIAIEWTDDDRKAGTIALAMMGLFGIGFVANVTDGPGGAGGAIIMLATLQWLAFVIDPADGPPDGPH